jgi:hypothetical protein
MKTKEKCYIAGKIGDLPESQYKAKFEKAKQEVINMGMDPISPVDLPHQHDGTWSSYMREDLTEMLKCNFVYALHDWRSSPGATIEITTALSVGLNVIHQEPLATEARDTVAAGRTCDKYCTGPWDCKCQDVLDAFYRKDAGSFNK